MRILGLVALTSLVLIGCTSGKTFPIVEQWPTPTATADPCARTSPLEELIVPPSEQRTFATAEARRGCPLPAPEPTLTAERCAALDAEVTRLFEGGPQGVATALPLIEQMVDGQCP